MSGPHYQVLAEMLRMSEGPKNTHAPILIADVRQLG